MRRLSMGQAERSKKPLQPQRRLPFEEIYSLFKDITSGLAYLNGANYIHRDLKPSNCLLHREGSHITCLISDFGEVQPENMVRKSTGSTGTISYCAPEVLRKDHATGGFGNFTAKSDIFSLGMILYFMCFGRLPYRSANTINEELEDIDQLRAEITDWKGFQDERRERPDLPSKLYQLLKRLLALNPADRPSASEVLAAMKSESSLDGATRAGGLRSSSLSIGLGGRRIQNPDSSYAPGTPVPGKMSHLRLTLWRFRSRDSNLHADPAKQARVVTSTDEDMSTSDSHTLQHGLHTGASEVPCSKPWLSASPGAEPRQWSTHALLSEPGRIQRKQVTIPRAHAGWRPHNPPEHQSTSQPYPQHATPRAPANDSARGHHALCPHRALSGGAVAAS